jgi:hypothetical protein
MYVFSLNLVFYCHISFSYIICFNIKIIHQRIQTTSSHASRCHNCSVDFVVFHNITCYTNSLLSQIHVNTTKLLNITCTFGCHKRDITKCRVYCSQLSHDASVILWEHFHSFVYCVNYVTTCAIDRWDDCAIIYFHFLFKILTCYMTIW